jgi:tRNA 5-methylaminomethyl-2-thiouridine biosynthesis bifunctional protein
MCRPAPKRIHSPSIVTQTAQAQAQGLLRGCGLPQAWAGQPAWRILDTQFQALRFLLTWQAWLADSKRLRLLHYVALAPQAPDAQELLQSAASHPELRSLAQALAEQCFGLLPGFHRLTLQQGQVLLTLCVGETRTLLREQQFEADSVFLDIAPDAGVWDRWAVKALARCCRRGTTLAWPAMAAELQDSLTQSGFELQGSVGLFNPRWELKTTREPLRTRAATPTTCAVIGAGLAGASVAAALARRGWQVQVYDSAPLPAAGASGLPVGLVVPHVSADDSPRSRLSRAGVRLTLQQLRELLEPGQDWNASGVLEQRLDGTPGLPRNWPASGSDWSRPAAVPVTPPAWSHGMRPGVPVLWHAQAAWVKPARLIQAWLAQPGVHFSGLAHVAELRREADQWRLLDGSGGVLGTADVVVLANACNVMHLLEKLQDRMPALRPQVAQLPTLHGMRGLLSWGAQQGAEAAALPPFPVNGLGSLIPSVPVAEGLAWYAGATYEAVEQSALPGAAHHQTNLEKLRSLLPAAAQALAPAFETGKVQAWGNTRCVSADRLPLVGALDGGDTPSLWISAAMGSRGLSFSVLCAELLAARLGAEPLPVEASLERFLHALRATQPVDEADNA